MWRNYLKTAWRALRKAKLYSAINLGGLALGLAAALVILVIVRHEFSYETWLPEAERIYQIRSASKHPTGEWYYNSRLQAALKHVLEEDLAVAEHVARLYETRRSVRRGETAFYERVAAVDPAFLDIFDLPFERGRAALPDLATALISERMAEKYFGGETPLGRTLLLDNEHTVEVTGVFRDLPENTHLELDFVVRFNENAIPAADRDIPTVATYVRTRPGADMGSFPALQERIVERQFGHWAEPGQRIGETLRLEAVPLPEIHLFAKSRDSLPAGIARVYTFAAVAVLVLAIAGFNFVNLTIARATTRIREIGLRQTVGATRRDLIAQFLGESLLLVSLAAGIGFLLMAAVLPWVEARFQMPLSMTAFLEPRLLAATAGLVALLGLGAGAYPAIYLSRPRPALRLHANARSDVGVARFRILLIAVQYAIAIALIVTTLIVYAQTRHVRTMDIGFAREDLIGLRDVGRHQSDGFVHRMVRELAQLPDVVSVTRSFDLPMPDQREVRAAELPGRSEPETLILDINPIGFGFFESLKASLVAGRSLDRALASDTLRSPENAVADGISEDEPFVPAAAIINETAVRTLGFAAPQGALGERIRMAIGYGQGNAEFTVVGVVGDLHWFSAHAEVFPTVYYRHEASLRNILVRTRPGGHARFPAQLNRLWAEMSPDVPLNRVSIAERYDSLYRGEERQMHMFSIFAALAVLTAGLGLYGLAVFAAERRSVEVAVRKVLGARTEQLARLLVWRLTAPVLAANLVAWPVSFYVMRDWLASFAQRIELTIWPFLSAGLLALAVAVVTVLGEVMRTARTHPATALREQ